MLTGSSPVAMPNKLLKREHARADVDGRRRVQIEVRQLAPVAGIDLEHGDFRERIGADELGGEAAAVVEHHGHVVAIEHVAPGGEHVARRRKSACRSGRLRGRAGRRRRRSSPSSAARRGQPPRANRWPALRRADKRARCGPKKPVPADEREWRTHDGLICSFSFAAVGRASGSVLEFVF